MKSILAILSSLILFPAAISAYHGKVTDETGSPIAGAGVFALDKDSTFICSAVTDSIGFYNIMPERSAAFLRFTSAEKEPKTIPAGSGEEINVSLTARATSLDAVEIVASNRDEYLDKTVFRLSKSQLGKYANTLLALNEIPFVKVLQSGSLFYKGFNSVTILIDGMAADINMLRSLPKSDIKDVEIYDMPPAKYLTAELTPVINVTTRSGLRGGSVTLYLDDDVRHLCRDENSVSAVYNYKDSRFTGSYNMSLSNTGNDKVSNTLEYEIDGTEYGKRRVGDHASDHRSGQSASLGFMNRKAGNYQFNADFSYSFSRNKSKTPQDVEYIFEEMISQALSRNYVKTNSYSGELYFNKQLNGKSNLSLNATGTYTPSTFFSSYRENLPGNPTPILDSETSYRGRFHSIQASAQYNLGLKFATLSLYLQNIYTSNKTIDAADTERIWYEQATFRPTLLGRFGQKFSWQITPGITYLTSNQKERPEGGKYSHLDFTPFLRVNWRLSGSLNIAASFTRYIRRPTLSEMNENILWIDSHYYFEGNSKLKPFSGNNLSLSAAWEAPFGSISGEIFYLNAPDYITSYFMRTPQGIKETYANVDKYSRLGLSLAPNIYLTRDRKLSFYALMNLSKVWGDGTEYSWHGVNFQLMPSLTYMVNDHWAFQVNYQYPGKVIAGHLIRPRAEHLGIYAIYSPINGMQISLLIENPFMDFKESEHTAKDAIVHTDFTTVARDYRNRISISFYYNIDFGKRRSDDNRSLRYTETENGVLTK